MSEEPTTRIGDYEILSVLGSGGMGKVFKVRNVISDRIEAMKILLPDLAGRQELADRFLREIKVLASLDHPNIASLRTALTLNNQLVMVMEFVEGVTLGQRLEQGTIPVTDAVDYTEQVLGALSYAHKRNVIHRDIKPANMMLTPESVVKLMDFGIARSGGDRGLTMTGTTIGSLYYMSPEQVKGETIDARSDLYSLGVSLYEMVTGQRPFRADSDYSIMAAHVQQLPKPPIELRSDLPAALNEIILTAIQKDPAQRFQTADAFRNALGSLRGKLPAAVAVSQSAPPVAPSIPAAAGATAMLLNAGASAHDAATATLTPPAQPDAVPSVLQMSAQQKTHRGLYMSLGALVVLVVLVVAGIYVPRKSTTRANEQAKEQSKDTQRSPDSSSGSANSSNASDDKSKQQASADADTTKAEGSADQSRNQTSESRGDGTTQPESKVDATTSTTVEHAETTQVEPGQRVSTSSAGKASNKHGLNVASKIDRITRGGQQDVGTSGSVDRQDQSAGQSVGSTHADAAQLEVLEKQADDLSSRVTAINDSLDNLRSHQSAQGYSLRRDIASAQELMKTHLAKAQVALQNQDAAGAKKYMDMAEADAAKIDQFLGH